MTITLEPTPQEIDFLEREARRRHISVNRLAGDLMREAILEKQYPEHEPNEETIAAFEEARCGEGTFADSVEDMFRQCGVS